MEKDFNDMDDFEELKHLYFDLGVKFRQFVIEYNINHDLIKEKTINIFLKQKSFVYLLSEKPKEPIDYNNDDTPIINNKEEKEIIKSAKENKQDKKQEIIDDLKEIRTNNKKQQEQLIL